MALGNKRGLCPSGASNGCQTARRQLDAGGVEPSHRALDGCLYILCQAAIAVEPGNGALHPTARQENEALSRVGALDDLDGPVAEAFERPLQLEAVIPATGSMFSWLRCSHSRYSIPACCSCFFWGSSPKPEFSISPSSRSILPIFVIRQHGLLACVPGV